MASGLLLKVSSESLRAFPWKGSVAFVGRPFLWGFRGAQKLQALLHLRQNCRVFHGAQIARIAPFRHGLKSAAQQFAAAGLG